MGKLKMYTNEVWLRRQYVTLGKSVDDIAKEQGVGKSTIDRYVAKFGLQFKRRTL